MFKKVKSFVPYLALAMPVLAGAQATINTIGDTVKTIIGSYVIPIIFAIAFIFFLLGVIKYIGSGGDEGARSEARNMMLYGIIGLFVMSAVWGLVQVLGDTFNVDENATIDIPDIPGINTP